MLNRDLIRLRHMVDSTSAILEFAKGKNREDLSNRLLASGVARELEILGEAANAVSPAVQERFNQVPWRMIIGMRNRLIHAYFDIDYDIVWKTVVEELPSLRQNLISIVSQLEAENE